MAYSTQTVVSDGSLSSLNITITYQTRDDIHVFFDDVEDAFDWAWVGTTDKSITFSEDIPEGVVVRVQRLTELDDPRHIFGMRAQGGSAQFTARSMDENFEQFLLIAQESRETAETLTDRMFDRMDAVEVLAGGADNKATTALSQSATALTQSTTALSQSGDAVQAAQNALDGVAGAEQAAIAATAAALLATEAAEDAAAAINIAPDLATPANVDPGKGTDMVVVGFPGLVLGPTDYTLTENLTARAIMFDRYFGADTTGTAASDSAFEKLVEYADEVGGNLTVGFTGRFIIVEPHTLQQSHIVLDFQGGLLDASSGSTTETWNVLNLAGGGKSETYATMSSDIPAGTVDLVVDSTSMFSAGDYLALVSTGEYFSGIAGESGFGVHYKGEQARVIRVLNSTTLRLQYGTKESYAGTTYSVRVHKLNYLQNITVRNMTAIGPGGGASHSSATPPGIGGIAADFIDGFTLDRAYVSNFPGAFGRSHMGLRHSFSNVLFQGRKLDDPSNIPSISLGFSGWRIRGTEGVDLVGCSMYDGRRMVDYDYSNPNYFNPSNAAVGVAARNIRVLGGQSVRCRQGPAGHAYQGLIINGHDVLQCDGGFQHRGKDLIIDNCRIVAGTGITCGGSDLGPGSYSESPMSGDVIIGAGVRIKSSGPGIQVRQGIDSFHSEAVIECVENAYYFFGKVQKNINIVPKITKLSGGSSGIVIRFQYTGIDRRDILIKGGYIYGGSQGIVFPGSSLAPADGLVVDGVTFKGQSSSLVGFDAGAAGLWGSSIYVRNCSHIGPLPGNTVVANNAGPKLANNTWT